MLPYIIKVDTIELFCTGKKLYYENKNEKNRKKNKLNKRDLVIRVKKLY